MVMIQIAIWKCRSVRCQLAREDGWATGYLNLGFVVRSELEIEVWELSA